MTADAPTTTSVDPKERLLRPRSVAIIGASDKKGALGTSVLANLERNGFAGDIFLVHPEREEIGGRKCRPSVAALPMGIDVAVLAIPRAGVLEAVRELAARGCGAAVIFSAGFAEVGAEGLAEQQEIARLACEAGMVVEGPNCLGMVNFIDAIPLTFVETQVTRLNGRPGIGIVSQSGAMACVLGTTLGSRDLGLSFSVSTGNEAASGVEDYVEYLINDTSTRVIAMIVEQFRNPQRFMAAARRALEVGKRIILLHPGKSAAARQSATTHTGAMAGDHAVMRVYTERAGVVLAETLEELADITEIAIRCPVLPSGGTAVVGESGAFKALMLDLCDDLGLDLPAIADRDSPALRAAMPPWVCVSNPLDLTAQGLVEPDLYYRTLSALIDDDRFGAIVMAVIQTDPVTSGIKIPPILRALTEMKPTKPVIYAGLDEGGEISDSFIAELRGQGVPCFPSSERAFRALKRLNGLSGRSTTTPAPVPKPTVLAGIHGVVPEYRAKAILSPVGIPFPPGRFVSSWEEACCAQIDGWPVVLKAQSADLRHKADAGGVILDIHNRAQLADAWIRLHANVTAFDPDLKLDGILIEHMGERGLELIIGARVDPEWGPVILAGLGGVAAEVFHDVRLLPPDLSEGEIKAELLQLRGARLLTGYRGAPALDIAAVATLITRLGCLLLSEPRIREIDLNPVGVYPQGVLALDALMVVD